MKHLLTRFTTHKTALLITLFVAQSAWLINTIAQAQMTLSAGDIYLFKTAPYDPYDAFRGRYVRLRFAENDKPFIAPEPCKSYYQMDMGYAILTRDERNIASITNISLKRPDEATAIKTTISCRNKSYTLYTKLPFERFYANELIAPELERKAIQNAENTYLQVRIRGRYAVPEKLLFDLPKG